MFLIHHCGAHGGVTLLPKLLGVRRAAFRHRNVIRRCAGCRDSNSPWSSGTTTSRYCRYFFLIKRTNALMFVIIRVFRIFGICPRYVLWLMTKALWYIVCRPSILLFVWHLVSLFIIIIKISIKYLWWQNGLCGKFLQIRWRHWYHSRY